MSEREYEVKPVGVRYICDVCGEGEMKPHGKVDWMADPIGWPHQCENCGHRQGLSERYPTVRFVEVKE